MEKRITRKEFGLMLDDKISDFVAQKIAEDKLIYKTLDNKERDNVLLKIISVLLDDSIPFSGKHRFEQWQMGWQENLEENLLIPKYYNKYDTVRVNGEFVKAVSSKFESSMISLITYYVADKYFRKLNNIFEFGCGPGHNLPKFREINNSAEIWGLDWVESSQKNVRKIAESHGDAKIFAKKFDYFSPDNKFKLPANSGVITVASLEQTGDNYKKFVNYLLKNKPEICVHIEPIAELLDQKNSLPDYLSVEYFKKRKYLNGFLDYLRKLELEGKIKIVEFKRTNSGSMFVDGHSLVVWSPVK